MTASNPGKIPGRPSPAEYPPYAAQYVDQVRGDDILNLLPAQLEEIVKLLAPLDETAAGKAYAPGKWTIKQTLGHIIDTERVFSYRALCFARNDAAALPGFEQDDYVRYGPFARCSFAGLVDEFRAVRASSIALFRNLDEEAWTRRGVANKYDVTVRGLAFLVAGHAQHHANILREKYLA